MKRYAALLFVLAGCEEREPGTSKAVRVTITANDKETPADATQSTTVRTGDTEITAPAGYDVVLDYGAAEQPIPSDEAATATVSNDGVSSNTGAAADTGPSALANTSYIGIVICVIGILLMLAKRAGWAAWAAPGPTSILLKFGAMLPKGTGIALIAFGAFLIMLEWFLEQLQPLVLPAACIVGLFAVIYIFNLIDNRKKKHLNDLEPDSPTSQSQ